MLDSSYHMTFELLKILFLAWKHHDFATLCSECYEICKTTSGLLILLHGVISLPNMMLCDKIILKWYKYFFF